jgi:osmotically inducible protein OsmC
MDRTGSAVWTGGIKDGSGTVSTETGALKELQYSFASRFESGVGTNPEELLGAAHAGCFSMALSGGLNKAGLSPERIDTASVVTVVPDGGGFTITKVHLNTEVKVAGVSDEQFQEIAEATKVGCPVSKLFKGAEITMTAKLV